VLYIGLHHVAQATSSKGHHGHNKYYKTIDGEKQTIEIADNSLALDLHRHLVSANPEDNVFVSPFSIFTAMAMVLTGTRGTTHQQLSHGLHLDGWNENEVKSEFGRLMRLLSSDSEDDTMEDDIGYTINLANRLYAQEDFTITPEFLHDTDVEFDARTESVNFRTNPEGARVEINDWVEQRTNGRIENLIPSDGIDQDTKLVLVNAIYFKGIWNSQFLQSSTNEGRFYWTNDDTDYITAQFMYQTNEFNLGYIEQLGNTLVLELPYLDEDLSMFILMPENGLQSLEQDLTVDTLAAIGDSMTKLQIHLYFPKFTFARQYGLKEIFSELGMNELFDPAHSDLSGIDETNSLYLSEVFHKAFIEVNEEGSEAAAASAGIASSRMALPQIEEVRINRPFLFYIQENTSHSILFMGRVFRPQIDTQAT